MVCEGSARVVEVSAVRRSSPGKPSEPWYSHAVYYKLPVKSFFDSNGDGIGDLQGLIQKLGYIADLGVTCLWLLPFFPSPLHDDGYDVADYRAIHLQLGTMDDFRALVDAVHARGLKIAAEMVINHTSDEHPWFRAACQAAPDSPLRQFYVWSDSPRAFSPESSPAHGEELRHWTWQPAARAFYWHRFGPHQPDLNYDCLAVRDEMLKVLRFWADLGVDGLCLNGASYLAERVGVGSEHLPETHATLRFFREELARDYPHIMLEAGVNAWPRRAAEYFGSGGECQTVPNLALAPQAFLALRQELSAPLARLAAQMPMLPAACQWVTLLRNHDELTLSLATDEERELLEREYAGGGANQRRILRRLAGLAQNDRRQMELLYALLLAWPGAPAIYYGDEIGMGDNPFLQHRGSVRSPMQWSSDQNGGFSTADSGQLFLPPVTDPVTGYQAVNVRAEQRNPSSLFHWLRRLIAVRRRNPAFARGSLEVLEVDNSHCLAIARSEQKARGQGDLLVVANLSARAQPVTVPVDAYQGLVPLELLGHSAFPRLEAPAFNLTLPPYGWFWFRLQVEGTRSLRQLLEQPGEQQRQTPSIAWQGAAESLFSADTRRELETNVFPSFLRSQRWFGGKALEIKSVTLADWARVPLQTVTAFHTVLNVTYANDQQHYYYVPLAVAMDADAAAWFEHKRSAVIALLAGDTPGVLLDAVASERFCSGLLESFARPQKTRTQSGVIRIDAADSFAQVRGSTSLPLRPRLGPATSSNSIVFFGRRLLFKVFRRLELGINPDYEVGQFLTGRQRFTHAPAVGGKIDYLPENSQEPYTLGILQALVPNDGDGWSHVLEELHRYYDRATARMFAPDPPDRDERSLLELAAVEPPPAAIETIAGYLESARLLGARTAEMHLALASDIRTDDFKPEPLTAEDLAELKQEVHFQANLVHQALEPNLSQLPEPTRSAAAKLLQGLHPAVNAVLSGWQTIPQATKTRVHGDYHLGQVLATDGDYVILDFEGEPTRTVAERRRKFSPLRDVAGMLRSYHYAAYAGLFAFTHDRPADFDRLAEWADIWQRWVSAAFLKSYLKKAAGASFLPREKNDLSLLLNGYMLAKALYELVYELNNRPDWVRIPLSGVSRLLLSN